MSGGGSTSGNPFGHVAIAFTGQGVYSYGTDTPLGGNLTDYLEAQAKYRDSEVYILETTPDQEAKMLAEILKFKNLPLPNPRNNLSGSLKDTCATRTQSALEGGGISSWFVPCFSPFPADTGLIASQNKNLQMSILKKWNYSCQSFFI